MRKDFAGVLFYGVMIFGLRGCDFEVRGRKRRFVGVLGDVMAEVREAMVGMHLDGYAILISRSG